MTAHCPNGKPVESTACTHPVCPVHRSEEERQASHAQWAALIERAQR